MSFGEQLYTTNYNIRKLFKKLETTRKKIVIKQWSIIFVKRYLDIMKYRYNRCINIMKYKYNEV